MEVTRRVPIGAVAATVALLATVAALGAACAGTNQESANGPASSAGSSATTVPLAPGAEVAGETLERQPVDPTLEQQLRAAVLESTSTGCGFERQGTVTMVDLDGTEVGLTNRHVVAGAPEVALVGPNGSAATSPVGDVVPQRDAAVVEIRPADIRALGATVLEAGLAAAVDDTVVVAGFPDGVFSARTGRVVAREPRTDAGGVTDVLVIDVPAAEGISGGVVVDGSGRAVGLVAARDPGTGFTVAYPLDTVRDATEPGPPAC